ncbi:enoyl-CoA hydratase/isomerase family protein [Ornithinimicrobium cavernae]|uniref:enoyl-CoA hydratase/isomerase family protein n=1 Tax=Ornithinimicrobium cavernae TaxID=2666047 RepID=UPI000D688193|nr:enoyl-CoA hydratase/isomerase family protein [Ornithinimicrobium cavernae]
MSNAVIKTMQDNGLLTITLNRPDVRNALSWDMIDALTETYASASASKEVRVILLRGEGRVFCAGWDRKQTVESAEDILAVDEKGSALVEAMQASPKFTVASVQGAAFGGGVFLAAACDYRIATTDSVFCLPEVRLGVPVLWGGMTALITEIGLSAARQLGLTGAQLDAQWALRTGMAHRLVQPDTLDESTAQQLESFVQLDPQVVGMMKRDFTLGRNKLAADGHPYRGSEVVAAMRGARL